MKKFIAFILLLYSSNSMADVELIVINGGWADIQYSNSNKSFKNTFSGVLSPYGVNSFGFAYSSQGLIGFTIGNITHFATSTNNTNGMFWYGGLKYRPSKWFSIDLGINKTNITIDFDKDRTGDLVDGSEEKISDSGNYLAVNFYLLKSNHLGLGYKRFGYDKDAKGHIDMLTFFICLEK